MSHKNQLSDNVFHLLAGLVNYEIVDKVLSQSRESLQEHSINENTLSILKTRWIGELSKCGAVPDKSSPSSLESQIRDESQSSQLTEFCPPIGAINNCLRVPKPKMAKPRFTTKTGIRIEYKFSKVICALAIQCLSVLVAGLYVIMNFV
jgi:hypothetical protein